MKTDDSRAVNLRLRFSKGGFLRGNKISTGGKITITPSHRISLESGIEYNHIKDLMVQNTEKNIKEIINFKTAIIRNRINFSPSPDLYARALTQWNSDKKELSINLLFNYIYSPGSDFYLVYNELRREGDQSGMKSRTIILKISHLFQL